MTADLLYDAADYARVSPTHLPPADQLHTILADLLTQTADADLPLPDDAPVLRLAYAILTAQDMRMIFPDAEADRD
ncbi:hypothetical protein ACMA1D_02085 [Streptomyces sp. 796.1]|uniref:hypothetical protein n=1 Tax=Streptomyces sp. 796.1 TaxID=3163029 RepID=UPI0039C9C144